MQILINLSSFSLLSSSFSAGNPNPPVFSSQVLSKSQTSYTISWVTESFTPIDEYKLLYRRLPVCNEVVFKFNSFPPLKLKLYPWHLNKKSLGFA